VAEGIFIWKHCEQGNDVEPIWGDRPEMVGGDSCPFSECRDGAFVVMPNHVHGIIYIFEECRGTVPVPEDHGENSIAQDNETFGINQGGETPPLRKPTLGQIVAYFKYQATKEMNKADNTGTVTKFWQRNYYEHIIRDETNLQNKTDYIESNPSLWDEDDENPVNAKK
jgi:REP element-mobilizing transposase RayT